MAHTSTTPIKDESSELRELRAQVRALQAEMAVLRESSTGHRASRRHAPLHDKHEEHRRALTHEIEDSFRDLLDRGADAQSRAARAIATGQLEHARLWAEEVTDFTRRVNKRNKPKSDETADEVVQRLPREAAVELIESVRRSFDFPQRTLERMQKSYDDTADLQPRAERREADVAQEEVEVVENG